ERLAHHRGNVTLPGDIGLDEDRVSARCLDLLDDLMAFVLAAAGDDNLRRESGKLDCRGTANARVTAGDQCHLSFELVHPLSLPPVRGDMLSSALKRSTRISSAVPPMPRSGVNISANDLQEMPARRAGISARADMAASPSCRPIFERRVA